MEFDLLEYNTPYSSDFWVLLNQWNHFFTELASSELSNAAACLECPKSRYLGTLYCGIESTGMAIRGTNICDAKCRGTVIVQ